LFENISNNKIIKRLIEKGKFSELELKKVYRELCKQTHPDITGKNSQEFIEIQNDYKIAKKYLTSLLSSNYNVNEFKPRIMLYKCLYNYNLYGLNSSKIRRMPELKSRNLSLTKELIFWANIYDQDFLKIFIEYNKKHIKDFNGWKEEEIFKKGRDYFIKGFNFFLEYQSNGNLGTKKVCLTYLQESTFELTLISKSTLRQSIANFANWLINELDKKPVLFNK